MLFKLSIHYLCTQPIRLVYEICKLTNGIRRTKDIMFVRQYDCDYEQQRDQSVEEEVPDKAGDPIDEWRHTSHELEMFALA